MHMSYTLYEKV